jgi:hypothetical protein
MTKSIDEKLLNRVEASAFLAEQGYRVSAATLAKLACSGDGPLMTTFGRAVLYHPKILLDWAERRSRLRANTSGDEVAASRATETEARQQPQPDNLVKKGNDHAQ